MNEGRTIPGPRTGAERGEAATAFAPYLFLVLACHAPSSGSARYSLDGIDEVRFGRAAARSAKREKIDGKECLVIGVADSQTSSKHARLVRTSEGFTLEDSGSTNGTRIDGQRIGSAPLEDRAVFQLGETLFLYRESLATPPSTAPIVDKGVVVALSTIVPAYEASLAAFARVALSTVPVLLLGESGTGKEVLARAVHGMSNRKGDFVPVNCGALPETLVESQLFGHVKGSFSGAVRDEPGFVRSAHQGTLFLDEIGDLPKTSQAALLRVLQEHEVTPVGSTQAVDVDLRVVAATHRRVDALQGEGGFRSDLYARLAGYTHELPSVRERMEDVGIIVKALLKRLSPDRAFAIAPDLGRAILDYAWPLNVREIEQALSVAIVLATDGVITKDHFPEPLRRAMAEARAKREAAESTDRVSSTSDEAVRDRLVASLTAHAGNVSEVARALGTSRSQVHRWLKRWAIDPETFRAT